MPPQTKKSTAGMTVETADVPVLSDPPPAEETDTAADTTMVTTEYGTVSLADLKDILRAELAAEAAAELAEEATKLPELCPHCFPEGWESKNALGQDGVGCEHGSWNKSKVKE
jgi:hypothetical protein